MAGEISISGQFATDWIKYSDYEIKKDSAGDVYIVPAKDAIFSMYNPFNVAEGLLLDLIRLGDEAVKRDKMQIDAALLDELLIFTRKYGLLGLVSCSVYNRNIIGDGVVLLMDNNHITREKMMDEESYLNKFMPFTEPGDVEIRGDNNCYDVRKREDSPKYYGRRPLILDLVFSRFYAEKVNWILGFARLISTHFNQLMVYKDRAAHLTEDVTIMAGRFHAEKIGFTIQQLDKTHIAWQFDSLKTAIELIYAFAVSDDSMLLARCKYCRNIFISGNTRTKYCGPTCRNRANVEKSRARKDSSG
ncbi:MAG: CGNR zinc finger domain-containing protein [Halanaerobium sp.]|nr:CGNR zinc finger domain-containing protein [Halanaerobium sp.]